MNHNGTEEFDLILNCLGYGDVKNALWFIGVEPGGGWNKPEGGWENNTEAKSKFKKEKSSPIQKFSAIDQRPEDIREWPIAQGTAKIASKLSKRCVDWRAYSDNHLWLDGSGVFNGNLLPVSKNNLSSKWWLNNDYSGLLGLTYEQYAACRQDILAHRKAMFDKLAAENKPQAIICFGKTHWNEFKDFFVAPNSETRESIPTIQVFEADKVILTHHFSGRFIPGAKDEMFNQVSKTLKEWGVELP
jgi:hypothetical protein